MNRELKRSENIRVERAETGVVTLTLDRPEIRNAFDDILIADLTTLFQRLARDQEVRVVVLTGAGKAFSAGADLGWMRRAADRNEHENFEDAMGIANLMEAVATAPMTTIAKVNGAAMGGGVGLVACCDIAVASVASAFAFSEVRLGIVPGAISPYVIAAIGGRAARRLFQTGERFDAAEALRLGLVHEVTPPEALDATVDGIVEELLKSGPKATRAAKALIRSVEGREIDDLVKRDSADRIARQRASDEGKEGLSAFLEKRKPGWMAD